MLEIAKTQPLLGETAEGKVARPTNCTQLRDEAPVFQSDSNPLLVVLVHFVGTAAAKARAVSVLEAGIV